VLFLHPRLLRAAELEKRRVKASHRVCQPVLSSRRKIDQPGVELRSRGPLRLVGGAWAGRAEGVKTTAMIRARRVPGRLDRRSPTVVEERQPHREAGSQRPLMRRRRSPGGRTRVSSAVSRGGTVRDALPVSSGLDIAMLSTKSSSIPARNVWPPGPARSRRRADGL
jgi:hypothetical protein